MKNKQIDLCGSCYYNMIRTVVESYPKESTGYLYGEQIRNKIILYNAHPIQTAIRGLKSVAYANGAAIQRLRKLDKAVGAFLRGGYHSHPKDESGYLTKGDLNFIEDEMDELNRESWIEIILRVNTIDYSRHNEVGEFFQDHTNKLSTIIRDDPLHGYKITLSAFKIDEDQKVQELQIKRRRIKKVILY
jgi:hypothetical protein